MLNMKLGLKNIINYRLWSFCINYVYKVCNIVYCILAHYYMSHITFLHESIVKVKYNITYDVHNKKIILIGGTSGIGLEVAKVLAKYEIELIIASNDLIGGHKARDLLNNYPAAVQFKCIDLSDPKSINSFVEDVKNYWISLDILINCAGIMDLCNKTYSHTNEKNPLSVDSNFLTNFLGLSLVTYLFLPLLSQGSHEQLCSRIVNVSSVLHHIGLWDINNLDGSKFFSGHGSYARSKLALTSWTIEFSQRLSQRNALLNDTNNSRNITVNCCHPGVVYTGLYKHFSSFTLTIVNVLNWFGLLRTSSQAAQTIIFLALNPSLDNVSGKYFENCEIVPSSSLSQSMEVRQDVWNVSAKFCSEHLTKDVQSFTNFLFE